MNCRDSVIFFRFLVASVLGATLVVPIPSVLASDEALRFSEKIVAITQANTGQIKTWSGEATFEQNLFDPSSGKKLGTIVSQFFFAVDVPHDRRISVSRIISDSRTEDDGIFRNRPKRITGFLVRDGLNYAFEGIDPSGPIYNPDNMPDSPTADSTKPYVELDWTVPPGHLAGNVRISVGRPPLLNFNFPNADYLNPFDALSLGQPDSHNVHSIASRELGGASSTSSVSLLEEPSTGHTNLRITSPTENGTIINEYKFDKNGLCVREFCGVKDAPQVPGRYEVITEKKYERIDDVWVPREIQYSLEHAKWHYKIVVTKQSINKPLDDSFFSLGALGVSQGDTVEDISTGEFYEITDSSLPKRDLEAYLKRRPTIFGLFQYGSMAIGVLLAMIWFFLKCRQWRARRKGGDQ